VLSDRAPSIGRSPSLARKRRLRLPLEGQEAGQGSSWHIRLPKIRNMPTVQWGHNLPRLSHKGPLFGGAWALSDDSD